LSNSYVSSRVHARNGSTWLGTVNGLDRWKNGNVAVYGERDGLPDPYALSLFEDQDDSGLMKGSESGAFDSEIIAHRGGSTETLCSPCWLDGAGQAAPV